MTSQLLDSKIKALQSQLNPHFLFNTLNDISALMEINVKKSQDAIADLSDLLRQTLNIKDNKYISLKEELRLLNKYVEIEKIRFGNKINYCVSVADNQINTMVPPLIFQPIVENSIKHGFSYSHDQIEIEIFILIKEDLICYKIKNNGALLDTSQDITYGTGISNVIERLDTLFDGNFVYNMKNEEPTGVLTEIEFPKTKP